MSCREEKWETLGKKRGSEHRGKGKDGEADHRLRLVILLHADVVWHERCLLENEHGIQWWRSRKKNKIKNSNSNGQTGMLLAELG